MTDWKKTAAFLMGLSVLAGVIGGGLYLEGRNDTEKVKVCAENGGQWKNKGDFGNHYECVRT